MLLRVVADQIYFMLCLTKRLFYFSTSWPEGLCVRLPGVTASESFLMTPNEPITLRETDLIPYKQRKSYLEFGLSFVIVKSLTNIDKKMPL